MPEAEHQRRQNALIDEPSIEAVRDEEIAAGVTRKRLVGTCNRLLQELRNGGREGVDVSV